MFGFLFGKKRKQAEELVRTAEQTVELQKDHIKVAEKAVEDSTELGRQYLRIAEDNTAIGKSLDSKSARLIGLVEHNEKMKESLSHREVLLRKNEDDMEERKKEIRKQEIQIVARNAEVRRRESAADRIDNEREDIKKRESAARKLAADSRNAKENYDAKRRKLDEYNNRLTEQEKNLQVRIRELDAREKEANAVFEKAKTVDAELTEKQRLFDEKCASIERELREKTDEYDRKLADIEAAGDTVASVKFDDSKEGKSAKIVVQEAIRQAKKNLEDGARTFGELQEKYCQGTFRGFSTPLEAIDKEFAKLSSYAEQVANHVREQDIVGGERIVNAIQENVLEADKCRKSWEFAGAFRHICYGLATCENYELLLQIINDMQDAGEPDDEARNEEEPDYYEILGVTESASEKDIERAYKKRAQEFHPDKHPNASDDEKRELGDKMAQINKARNILLDKDKRSEYNRNRKSS